ncbi:MAG: beta-ketoacyl synthase [Betaproteobacteria bacterium]|nr:beta-ketoacyl synthase [Betaproteobacteria bacterium]
MLRPVHIVSSGLLCARGDSPAAVRDGLWAGEYSAGRHALGERCFPYYPLPLDEPDWYRRAEHAVRHVSAQLGSYAPATPLFVASSSFQIGLFEQRGVPFCMPIGSASFSQQIADWMTLTGSRTSFSNACISGFSAIDAASTLITAGLIDDAIIVGIELVNNSTLAGFGTMELLSPTVCRPLDTRRDGLVLGEAVAAIKLSATPGPWKIAGLATGLDAYSTTGPDPQGGPIAEVIHDCLRAAGIAPSAIDLIKLQAAGSPGSDLAEANALRQVFGEIMPPLISLKPALGHTLGASGITELAALLGSLDAGQIPATGNYGEMDSEIGLAPVTVRRHASVRFALLNLIGFGGGLASLLVERN